MSARRRAKPAAPDQGALFIGLSADLEPIEGLAAELARAIAALPLPDRVEALNRARRALHAISPFAAEPVDCVEWWPAEVVDGNAWNPNVVPPVELQALEHSMRRYGITMPIVGSRLAEAGATPLVRIRINDGFHRNVIGRGVPDLRLRFHGYLPISLLQGSLSIADHMAATELHNQARGTHDVQKEIAIVRAMGAAGWDDQQIGLGTVKSGEELVRIRQTGGVASALASSTYASAWKF